MADVYSWTERLNRLDQAEEGIATLRALYQDARDYEIDQRRLTFVTATLESLLEARIAGVSELVTSFVDATLTQLTDNNAEVWQMVVKPAWVVDWDSTAVDVDDGASGSTLTANDGAPFTGFEVGDVVSITHAESTLHNVERTIGTVTATVMTFTATLPGADAATDESLTVTLVER